MLKQTAGCPAIGSVVAMTVGLLFAGCTNAINPNQLLSHDEIAELVTDHTLRVTIHRTPTEPSLLYLTRDGTGWMDDEILPNEPVRPGRMSMVIQWYVADDSRICVWTTPLIGEMPSFAPPRFECLQILHAPPPDTNFTTVVMRDDQSYEGVLDVYPYNVFPPATIDQYLTQVRVLYGGNIPTWPRYRLVSGSPAAPLAVTTSPPTAEAISAPAVSIKTEPVLPPGEGDNAGSQPVVLQPHYPKQ